MGLRRNKYLLTVTFMGAPLLSVSERFDIRVVCKSTVRQCALSAKILFMLCMYSPQYEYAVDEDLLNRYCTLWHSICLPLALVAQSPLKTTTLLASWPRFGFTHVQYHPCGVNLS